MIQAMLLYTSSLAVTVLNTAIPSIKQFHAMLLT